MPYYVNTDSGVLAGPGEIEPSSRLSLQASVASAINGNASSLLVDYAELQQANQRGQRLSQQQANDLFKGAGLKATAPAGGYTQEAVDILIKRQRNDQLLRQVDSATPWSWLGSPVRGGAMLLAGVSDPLNIASAFIPVVREARAASLLARAASPLERAAVRGMIGATEGAVGAAVLEAPTYALHRELGDEYTLTDSLLNMAFGTAAGGGLHAATGAVGDAVRGGGNPYARFAGLNPQAVRQVMDYEAGRLTDPTGFTAAQRRAAGIADQMPEPVQGSPAPMAASRTEPRAPLAQVAEAPFAKLYEMTPETARARAVDSLREEIRAELLSQTSGRAEPGAIRQLQSDLASTGQRIATLQDAATFKQLAKDAQEGGLSRKEAEASARRQIADQLADAQASQQRIEQQIEANARASQAEQHLAGLDADGVPAALEARVAAEARSFMAAADLARAITGHDAPPAAFTIGMVSPETREAVMRTALADFARGRLPNVDAALRTDPEAMGQRATPQDVAAAAAEQRKPAALYLGSRDAAGSAQERLSEGKGSGAVSEAPEELADAMDRLGTLQKKLAANGMSSDALYRLTNLQAFDDEIKRARSIGEVSRIGAICEV